MIKNLLRPTAIFVLTLISATGFAQDIWTPSQLNGFGDIYNHSIKTMHVFKGKLYAGTADDSAKIYSTTTGNLGSWAETFTDTNITSINKITSVTNGGGYMYAVAYAPFSTIGSVYKTSDGNSWGLYFTSPVVIKDIVPFKGSGSVDSLYVIENGSFGDVIKKSAYNSNDPYDSLSAWDTVLDFANVDPYTQVNSTIVHNGKFYLSTTNGGKIYSSADGMNWLRNNHLDSSFTDPYNYAISALGSFGGYLYAGTYNYSTGTEIWRSNDDSTWTMVGQFSNYDKVTSFYSTGGEIWASMTAISSYDPGQLVKSSDGINFIVSENAGFGDLNNSGEYGNFEVFGNNLYYGSENYGYNGGGGGGFLSTGGSTRGIGYSTGAQIWRKCLGTPPTVNIGADQTICSGTTISFNAGLGYSTYFWDDASTGQTLTTSIAGNHFVIVTDVSGCDASDTANVTVVASPDVTITSPVSANVTVCKGDSLNVIGTAASNLRIIKPPFSKVTHDSISYYLGNTFDTLAVAGIGECSCTSLYSITIDSLYHNYDSDLSIMLRSPSGDSIHLISGAYGTNFIGTELLMTGIGLPGNFGFAPYTGQFLPLDAFNNLTGSADGNWIIETSDNYATDDGVLKGWTLKFTVADSILTYSWSPTTGVSMSMALNTSITPSSSRNYYLTTTNTAGCSTVDTISVFIPKISITNTNDSLCYGSSTTLATDGTVNSIWTPSASLSSSTGISVIATPLVSTMYYVSDIYGGCLVTDSTMVTVDSAINAVAGSSKGICFGDSTSLYGSASSGTPPYSYFWAGGTTSDNNAYVEIGPTVTTEYTFYVTDAFGCTKTDSLSIAVAPNTDIYGHVNYSGGNVTASNVVLYKYYPYQTHFDTVQTSVTDASGNYHFTAVAHKDYIIKIFPAATYTTLIPTYYGNTFLWDSASIIYHYCAVDDTLNITASEDSIFATGPGYLHGRIVEDTGYVRVPGEPIPGIDVKLGRNPGGALVTSVTTDTNGEYEFTNVAYGNYTVFADIPGLGRDSSYTFTVDSANSTFNYLDYEVDSSEVHYVPNAGVGIHPVAAANENKFSVYPNPSKGNATIEYSISVNTEVKLGIFNVLGVEVSSLVSTHQQAGTYKYNISDNNFNPGSGVYFVALIVNGKTSIHKIIITQ